MYQFSVRICLFPVGPPRLGPSPRPDQRHEIPPYRIYLLDASLKLGHVWHVPLLRALDLEQSLRRHLQPVLAVALLHQSLLGYFIEMVAVGVWGGFELVVHRIVGLIPRALIKLAAQNYIRDHNPLQGLSMGVNSS